MTELFWNQHADWPLLATLQLLPLIGVALLVRLGEKAPIAWLGRAIAALEAAGLPLQDQFHILNHWR